MGHRAARATPTAAEATVEAAEVWADDGDARCIAGINCTSTRNHMLDHVIKCKGHAWLCMLACACATLFPSPPTRPPPQPDRPVPANTHRRQPDLEPVGGAGTKPGPDRRLHPRKPTPGGLAKVTLQRHRGFRAAPTAGATEVSRPAEAEHKLPPSPELHPKLGTAGA